MLLNVLLFALSFSAIWQQVDAMGEVSLGSEAGAVCRPFDSDDTGTLVGYYGSDLKLRCLVASTYAGLQFTVVNGAGASFLVGGISPTDGAIFAVKLGPGSRTLQSIVYDGNNNKPSYSDLNLNLTFSLQETDYPANTSATVAYKTLGEAKNQSQFNEALTDFKDAMSSIYPSDYVMHLSNYLTTLDSADEAKNWTSSAIQEAISELNSTVTLRRRQLGGGNVGDSTPSASSSSTSTSSSSSSTSPSTSSSTSSSSASSLSSTSTSNAGLSLPSTISSGTESTSTSSSEEDDLSELTIMNAMAASLLTLTKTGFASDSERSDYIYERALDIVKKVNETKNVNSVIADNIIPLLAFYANKDKRDNTAWEHMYTMSNLAVNYQSQYNVNRYGVMMEDGSYLAVGKSASDLANVNVDAGIFGTHTFTAPEELLNQLATQDGVSLTFINQNGNSFAKNTNDTTYSDGYGVTIINGNSEEVKVSGLKNPLSFKVPLTQNQTSTTIEPPAGYIYNGTVVECVWLNETTSEWSNEGCEFAGYDGDTITCKCNHLTLFAATFRDVLVPEKITMHDLTDPNAKWPALIAAVVILVGLWVIGICVTLYYDRHRNGARRISPALKTRLYNITFETKDEVICNQFNFQFNGHDMSDEFPMIVNTMRDGCYQSHLVRGLNVGKIISLTITSPNNEDSSFVSSCRQFNKVRVIDYRRQIQYSFNPEEETIAANTYTYPPVKKPIIYGEEARLHMTFSQKLKMELYLRILDRHLWLSIFCRPRASAYTSFDRFLVGYMWICITAACGMAWFTTYEGEVAARVALKIIVAIIVSAISFAAVTPMEYLLRNSAVTHRGVGRFGYWVRLLAYTLISVVSLGCIVVCGFYILKLAKHNLILDWFESFLFSVFETITISQPILVLIIATIAVLRKTKDSDTGEGYGHLDDQSQSKYSLTMDQSTASLFNPAKNSGKQYGQFSNEKILSTSVFIDENEFSEST